MTETQTVVEVKDFDDVLAEFDKPEQKSEESSKFVSQESSFEEALEKGKEEPEKKEEKATFSDVVDIIEKTPEEEKEKETNVSSEAPLYSAMNKLIEKGNLFLFDDKQDLKDYTEDELIELLEANDKHKKENSVDTEISEFFDSLPEEIQYAAKYVADGGKDLKGLFKALAAKEEITSLDAKEDAELIIKNYYSALEWDDDDIKDKIQTLKDLGKDALEKESTKVKPKLDKMHEEVIQADLSRQEKIKESQMKEMQTYFDNAANTIKKGTIGDIKLDKKLQVDLYSGLTQANHKTRRGTPTNELGHLLEKYQYTEPDFEKMYKVLWLLKDENSFFEKFSSKEVNKSTEKIVRTLKTEQGKKDASSTLEEQEQKANRKTIKRQAPDFMSGLNS